MKKEIVKASKVVKGMTSTVRSHFDAVERAREIYLAQIKRAEAEYFERIKHASEIVTGIAPEAASTPPQDGDQPAAASAA